MIIESYYISEHPVRAQRDTGLASDELESVVGRFHNKHERRGKLRGEVLIYADGSVKIRHHFKKTVLWEVE